MARNRRNMARSLAAVLAAALFLLGPWVESALAEAEHESGCITCHQYAGLAVVEPDGRKRVLDIDEDARNSAPHARVRCVECHSKIDRTPHDGIDVIECTGACHEKDRAKIEAIDLANAGIHDGEQTAIATIDHRSACVSCHSIYPHKKDRHIRAIFNLHSAHLYCEVCHLEPERASALSYGWSAGDPVTFTGKPYGKILGKVDGGWLLARIGLFEVAGDKRTLVQHSEDLAAVGAYMMSQETMTNAEKIAEMDFFHRGIVRKKITVACSECHKENGRLDFRALGYTEHRAEELESLNMRGWATRYDTFYFPKLF